MGDGPRLPFARNLAKTYRKLLLRRRSLGLEGVVWFSMRDYDRPGWDSWAFQMRLFEGSKSAKPAWQALASVTGGKAAPVVEPPASRSLLLLLRRHPHPAS